MRNTKLSELKSHANKQFAELGIDQTATKYIYMAIDECVFTKQIENLINNQEAVKFIKKIILNETNKFKKSSPISSDKQLVALFKTNIGPQLHGGLTLFCSNPNYTAKEVANLCTQARAGNVIGNTYVEELIQAFAENDKNNNKNNVSDLGGSLNTRRAS